MPTDVLVGPVPLRYVQSLSITEGYKFDRVSGSKFVQAFAPTQKQIAIKAILFGQDRLLLKKGLELLALTSRLLLSSAAPLLNITGIPVIAGLTISLDMQISNLVFTQNVQNREALNVDITLIQVPRSSAIAILGEVADLVVAAGASPVSSAPAPSAAPRVPGKPL